MPPAAAAKPTRGLNGLLAPLQEFEIGENRYRLRRLGLNDLVEVMAIGREVWAWGVHDLGLRFANILQFIQDKSVQEGVIAILPFALGVPEAREYIYNWLGSIIDEWHEEKWSPISVDTFKDPEHFPLGFMPHLFRLLATNPDVMVFFDSARNEMQNPLVQGLFNKAKTLKTKNAPQKTTGKTSSTPSSPPMPGQLTRSSLESSGVEPPDSPSAPTPDSSN